MVITSTSGVRVATRGRTPVTYEKIDHRWHIVYFVKGTYGKTPIKTPVRHIRDVKAGTL